MTEGEDRRYVPSGVDAETWLGFEQRVRARRFRALLDTAMRAIDAGNVIDARIALEEARELRPNAPELPAVEDRLADLSVVASVPADREVVRSRTLSAVMMLVVGVTLLTGIEWIRSASTDEAPAAAPELEAAAQPAAAVNAEAAVAGVNAEAPVTIVAPPPADEIPEPAPAPASSADRVVRSEPAPQTPLQPTLVPASTLTRPVVQPVPNGEIPDDYVFAPVTSSRAMDRGTAGIGAARAPLDTGTPDPEPEAAPRAADVPPVAVGSPGSSRIVASIAPSAASAAPAAPIVRRNAGDVKEVAAVLNKYALAYGQLDAGAAREVWPTVDERALARAFAGLASQDVAFEDCEIDVHGVTANASCRGTASYVGKVGSGVQRTEARTWRFELRRDGEDWKIENAEARRQ